MSKAGQITLILSLLVSRSFPKIEWTSDNSSTTSIGFSTTTTSIGSSCTDASGCDSGYCDDFNVCQSGCSFSEGTSGPWSLDCYCETSNNQCGSTICTANVCESDCGGTSSLAIGCYCDDNSQCSSSYCTANACANACSDIQGDGPYNIDCYCTDPSDCVTGVCTSNACASSCASTPYDINCECSANSYCSYASPHASVSTLCLILLDAIVSKTLIVNLFVPEEFVSQIVEPHLWQKVADVQPTMIAPVDTAIQTLTYATVLKNAQ
mmetsp:Transcript_34333/g.25406  ORF Transcript_34333/g.25406 Transcript_34333/m.25406 type:complete len:266 (-) Transcript_34333:1094-1891(-)